MRYWLLALAAGAIVLSHPSVGRSEGLVVPPPSLDDALAPPGSAARTTVLSGGCFWGVQAVYQHVRGVTKALSGYAGGSAWTANYEAVSLGQTSHAESVQITYDPSRITYGQLLRVFFSVVHDPTTRNRQGPDYGTQYRSAIFFGSGAEERVARAYIAQLNDARTFKRPIVTEVTKLPGFYEAEAYHQDYATRHPNDPYIMTNDAPKVAALKSLFPDVYVGQ